MEIKDIWYKIITDHLSIQDFFSLSSVSKRLRKLYDSPSIWKKLLERDYDIKTTSDDCLPFKYFAAHYFYLGKTALRLTKSTEYFTRAVTAINHFSFEKEPWAKYLLGSILLNGWAGRRDVLRGTSLLKEAGQNYFPAIKELYTYLYNNFLTRKDRKSLRNFVITKLIEFTKELKHPQAIIDLAMCYHKSFLFKKDLKLAVKYFQTAIDRGLVDAYCYLGSVYLELNQPELAIQTFNEGLSKDVAKAAQCVGKYYQDKYQFLEAIKWYKEAFSKGFGEAALNIASLYFNGFNDVTNGHFDVDYVHAEEWYQKAFESGYNEGAFMVAVIKLRENSQESAIHWLENARETGCVQAAILLGDIFSQANQFNIKKAISYYDDAFELGDKQSLTKITDLIFNHFNSVEDNYLIKSIYWIVLAAKYHNSYKEKICSHFSVNKNSIFDLVLAISNILLNNKREEMLKLECLGILKNSSSLLHTCNEVIEKLSPFFTHIDELKQTLSYLFNEFNVAFVPGPECVPVPIK